MPDSASSPDKRARQFAAIRDHARRALIGLARDRGAEFTTREAYRGSDTTIRGLGPLAGARAARDIELGARHAARAYIRTAREAGHGWDQIGQALGVTPNADADQAGADRRRGRLHLHGRPPRHRGTLAAEIVPVGLPVLRPGDQRPRPDRRACRRRARPHRQLLPAGRRDRRVERRLGGRAVTARNRRPGPYATGQTAGECRDTGHRPDYVIELCFSPQMRARNPDRPLPLWEALEAGQPRDRDAAPVTPASCPGYDTAATCAREVRDLEAEA